MTATPIIARVKHVLVARVQHWRGGGVRQRSKHMFLFCRRSQTRESRCRRVTLLLDPSSLLAARLPSHLPVPNSNPTDRTAAKLLCEINATTKTRTSRSYLACCFTSLNSQAPTVECRRISACTVNQNALASHRYSAQSARHAWARGRIISASGAALCTSSVSSHQHKNVMSHTTSLFTHI